MNFKDMNRLLFIATCLGILLTLAFYLKAQPYAFHYSPTPSDYAWDTPPQKECTTSMFNGTRCKLVNVPYGEQNMFVFRDQSFLGKTVAFLHTYQFFIGLLLFAWGYWVNKDKLKELINTWKKRTN